MKIRLNRADRRELALLPSVGPHMAARIEGHRQQQGAFESWTDFNSILGVGAATIQVIEPWCEIDQIDPGFYRSHSEIELSPPPQHTGLVRWH
ncbi:ComEA family DNA-binding protein [Aporhodopirellula aestuarii]|uniref:Helix-hairpin-helix domain-containing protein n=1 Tax=Aporhodopirellula aestuarii TaxID=2950107 RepID=A0ABT0UE07_9BACT|nr:helix-hairpin-helix domain-containing protein [Aporhodopirellula aestuarii]MCM2374964.1 helix-hairpin-helix domain-containing protein [Aporhodopirellula aestuarii]